MYRITFSVFRFHYHSQKVIGSLGRYKWSPENIWILLGAVNFQGCMGMLHYLSTLGLKFNDTSR